MNKQNTNKLINDFPRLYRGCSNPPSETRMNSDFDCLDGWFDLLYQLSVDIEAEAYKAGLEPNSDAWPEAYEVIQKYGTLNIWVNSNVDAIWDLIEKAGAKSSTICECCGQPGKLRERAWIRTYCDKCDALY